MAEELRKYENMLRDNKLKITARRMTMIELFINEDRYLSAKEVQEKLHKVYPSLSYDTIYRNLHTLKEIEVLEGTSFEGEMQFKIACSDHHHHHFICESCGDTKVIRYCPFETWQKELKDVEITNHKVELYGFCQRCRPSA